MSNKIKIQTRVLNNTAFNDDSEKGKTERTTKRGSPLLQCSFMNVKRRRWILYLSTLNFHERGWEKVKIKLAPKVKKLKHTCYMLHAWIIIFPVNTINTVKHFLKHILHMNLMLSFTLSLRSYNANLGVLFTDHT